MEASATEVLVHTATLGSLRDSKQLQPLEVSVVVTNNRIDRQLILSAVDQPLQQTLPRNRASDSIRIQSRLLNFRGSAVSSINAGGQGVTVDQQVGGRTNAGQFHLALGAVSIGSHDIQRDSTLEFVGSPITHTVLEDAHGLLARADRANGNVSRLSDDASNVVVICLIGNHGANHFDAVNGTRLRNQRANSFDVVLLVLVRDHVVDDFREQTASTGERLERVRSGLQKHTLLEIVGNRQRQGHLNQIVTIQTGS